MNLNQIPCLLVAALIAVTGCSTPPSKVSISDTMETTWAEARGGKGPLDFPGGSQAVAVTRVRGMDIFPKDTGPARPWLCFGVFSQSPRDSIDSVVRFARSRGAEFLVVHDVVSSGGDTYVMYRAARYGTLPK